MSNREGSGETARIAEMARTLLKLDYHGRLVPPSGAYVLVADLQPGLLALSDLLSRLSASPDVEARCVDLIAERERAMKVLQPNVPESGLEDACRQVKQAAISWRDNYETMEYVYDILKAKLEEAEARLTTSASPADVGPQAQGITAPASDDWMRGYETRIFEEPSTVVLQAVLEAISGTLDPHSQIADHPNVKFAQMERLKLLAGTVSQAQEKA